MKKFIVIVSVVLLNAALIGNSAKAITATEMINKNRGSLTSSKKMGALIKKLPPLTDEEKKRATQFMEAARLQDAPCTGNSCSTSQCYANCMCGLNAAICCNGQVCIGGDCDFGQCVGDPSRGNEFASLACGINCL